MNHVRRYIRSILSENQINLQELFKRPFKMSDDSMWNAGQVVFYFDRPKSKDDIYGIPRGEVHGEASHAIKHAREFITRAEREKFLERVIAGIKSKGIETVWQGRGSKQDKASQLQVSDLELPVEQWENKRNRGLKRIKVDQLNQHF